MDRRRFLVSTGLATTGAVAVRPLGASAGVVRDEVTSPNASRSDGVMTLRAQLSPTFANPYYHDAIARFAGHLAQLTGGRLCLTLPAPPKSARTPKPAHDGVFQGLAEGDVWFGLVEEWPAASGPLAYFAGLPGDFGLAAVVHRAWLFAAGGQDLWDEIMAPMGAKPFLIGHLMPAGGWAHSQIAGRRDLQGACVAGSRLTQQVLARLGARPDAGLATAAFPERGPPQSCAYAEPCLPFAVVLSQLAGAEPRVWVKDGIRPSGAVMMAAIDIRTWEALSLADRAVLTSLAAQMEQSFAAEMHAHDLLVAPSLVAARQVVMRSWPGDIGEAIETASAGVVVEIATQSEETRRIHAAYMHIRHAATGRSDPLAAGSALG